VSRKLGFLTLCNVIHILNAACKHSLLIKLETRDE
jgi:hypothetical protein